MSFKSKGPNSQPSQSPKANPESPKLSPEKDSKSSNHKPNQNFKPQPGKNRQVKNQKPTPKPNKEAKNDINPPPLDLNKDAKNIISNLTSQPNKEPREPSTKLPLKSNNKSNNRIIRPVFKPNLIQNGKNKITRPTIKLNPNKGSKSIISHLIFEPNKVSNKKNKIVRPKFDPNEEPKNRIIRRKFNPNEQPKNRIVRLKFDPNDEPKRNIVKNEIKIPMVKSDKELKINLNEKLKINQRDSPKLDGSTYSFKNLLDKEIQNVFKNYHLEIGKFANYGRNLKKDFIDWLEKTEKDPDLINKVKDIQNNHGIASFIKDQVRNSELSQNKIADKLNETGLSISRKTVGNISLKEVYNYNKDAHHQRFDISLDSEIKERITNRLNKELEKYTSGVQHDSLYKIAKDFSEVSKTIIDRLAKNEISHEVYGIMWPSTSGTVSNDTKKAIKNRLKEEAQNENPCSLRSISDDFPGASHTYIMDSARELFPNNYKDLWSAIKKIPDEIKNEIINTIKEETLIDHPRTLRDIHKDFPEVGADTIKRFAKQVIPRDLHDKIWTPLTTEIPKELTSKITKIIRDEINKQKPSTLTEIGRNFNVSTEFIRKLAKKTISKQKYEDIWKSAEPITDVIKNCIINDIINTKLNISEIAEKNNVSSPSVSNISQREVFQDNTEDHRKRFPIDENLEIGTFTHLNLNSLITRTINDLPNQKYYAEPKIFLDKRRPDGLILEDNNFIHQRLTNSQNGEYLRDKLELNPKNLDNIKSTQFDFTNDISDENIINKIEKYQSEDALLVIVGTRWYLYDEIKQLPIDDKIKYPENVRIISSNLSGDLIGLEGKDKVIYDKIIEFNNKHDLNSLKMLYYNDLFSINNHNTEELKEDLIQKGLLKENLNEFFKIDEKNKKDCEEKQLDLDHFLNL